MFDLHTGGSSTLITRGQCIAFPSCSSPLPRGVESGEWREERWIGGRQEDAIRLTVLQAGTTWQ